MVSTCFVACIENLFGIIDYELNDVIKEADHTYFCHYELTGFHSNNTTED